MASVLNNNAVKDIIRCPSTDEDEPFLRSVYDTTRADEMALVPWNDAEKRAFLDMQFHAQHTYYHAQFPNAKYDLLVRNGEQIGRLYTDKRETELRILDIAILPEFRNQGVGTGLIQGLMAEAQEAGIDLTLHVETFNPARRLYERLNFGETQVDGIYILMTWNGR